MSAPGARDDALNTEGTPVKADPVELSGSTEGHNPRKLPAFALLRPLGGILAKRIPEMRHDEFK